MGEKLRMADKRDTGRLDRSLVDRAGDDRRGLTGKNKLQGFNNIMIRSLSARGIRFSRTHLPYDAQVQEFRVPDRTLPQPFKVKVLTFENLPVQGFEDRKIPHDDRNTFPGEPAERS
jgi:hypothetical protein